MIDRNDEQVQSILPYEGKAFDDALRRVFDFEPLMGRLTQSFPGLKSFLSEVDLSKIHSCDEFQSQVIATVVREFQEATTRGVSVSGFEHLKKNQKYLFISNHRDIICDPALISYQLFLHGLPTPKICLGDNLLVHPIIEDLVKINKGMIVKRNLPARELLRFSQALSQAIHQQISQSLDSVWIAQREGRAKDGDDSTHSGILKMLLMSSENSTFSQLKELNIVPLVLSYEYDPCDVLKALELFRKESQGSYQKVQGEDAQSMLKGMMGQKGRVHLHVCKPLNTWLDSLNLNLEQQDDPRMKRELISLTCQKIDQEIQSGYRCWPSHAIAMDQFNGADRLSGIYTQAEKQEFFERLDHQLRATKQRVSGPGVDWNLVEQKVLRMYARPVMNQAEWKSKAQ